MRQSKLPWATSGGSRPPCDCRVGSPCPQTEIPGPRSGRPSWVGHRATVGRDRTQSVGLAGGDRHVHACFCSPGRSPVVGAAGSPVNDSRRGSGAGGRWRRPTGVYVTDDDEGHPSARREPPSANPGDMAMIELPARPSGGSL